MPQNEYMEQHRKREGRRLDHEERERKKEARSAHKKARFAKKVGAPPPPPLPPPPPPLPPPRPPCRAPLRRSSLPPAPLPPEALGRGRELTRARAAAPSRCWGSRRSCMPSRGTQRRSR